MKPESPAQHEAPQPKECPDCRSAFKNCVRCLDCGRVNCNLGVIKGLTTCGHPRMCNNGWHVEPLSTSSQTPLDSQAKERLADQYVKEFGATDPRAAFCAGFEAQGRAQTPPSETGQEVRAALQQFVDSHLVASPHGRIIECGCKLCKEARAALRSSGMGTPPLAIKNLKRISLLLTGNEYAFLTENPEIDEAVQVYVEQRLTSGMAKEPTNG